ncbi:hypothetical protein DESC_940093 [Desulfosarcina cetonica]|nr:hypothetical protein DESC_940093 [Desulfosarcina cetonica]
MHAGGGRGNADRRLTAGEVAEAGFQLGVLRAGGNPAGPQHVGHVGDLCFADGGPGKGQKSIAHLLATSIRRKGFNGFYGQCDPHTGPRAGLAFQTDPAAMQTNNLLDDAQAQPGSAISLTAGFFNPVERLANPLQLGGGNAVAGIENDQPDVRWGSLDGDMNFSVFPAIFNGIVHQVDHDLPQLFPIAGKRHGLRDVAPQRDTLILDRQIKILQHRFNKVAQVKGVLFQGRVQLQRRKGQQGLDQAVHLQQNAVLVGQLPFECHRHVIAVNGMIHEEPQYGNRAFQLVGRTGQKLFLLVERELQTIEHLVQGNTEFIELVPAVSQRDSFAQGFLIDFPCQMVDPTDRLQDLPGHEVAQAEKQKNRRRQPQGNDPDKFTDLRIQLDHGFGNLDPIPDVTVLNVKQPYPEGDFGIRVFSIPMVKGKRMCLGFWDPLAQGLFVIAGNDLQINRLGKRRGKNQLALRVVNPNPFVPFGPQGIRLLVQLPDQHARLLFQLRIEDVVWLFSHFEKNRDGKQQTGQSAGTDDPQHDPAADGHADSLLTIYPTPRMV